MDISKDTATSTLGSFDGDRCKKKAASKRGLEGNFSTTRGVVYFGVVACGLVVGAGRLAGAPVWGLVPAGRAGAATPDWTL
jgi:hypothetical protein